MTKPRIKAYQKPFKNGVVYTFFNNYGWVFRRKTVILKKRYSYTFNIGYGTMDMHSDVLLPGYFTESINMGDSIVTWHRGGEYQGHVREIPTRFAIDLSAPPVNIFALSHSVKFGYTINDLSEVKNQFDDELFWPVVDAYDIKPTLLTTEDNMTITY